MPVHVVEPATPDVLKQKVLAIEKAREDVIQVTEHGGAWVIVTRKRARTETR